MLLFEKMEQERKRKKKGGGEAVAKKLYFRQETKYDKSLPNTEYLPGSVSKQDFKI